LSRCQAERNRGADGLADDDRVPQPTRREQLVHCVGEVVGRVRNARRRCATVPGEIGHDHVAARRVELAEQWKEVFELGAQRVQQHQGLARAPPQVAKLAARDARAP
jgi:hypothetical protein